MSTESEILAELAAKDAIKDVNLRYMRGIDRCDLDLVKGAYWPDATDQHGELFKGNAWDFAEMVIPYLLETYDASFHFMQNLLVVVDGDVASGEVLHLGYHIAKGDGTIDCFGARYLDEYSLRDGEWRISDRFTVVDTSWHYPAAPQSPDLAKIKGPGDGGSRRDRGDASYAKPLLAGLSSDPGRR